MSSETVRVLVPLSIRRRNGRPRILPPENALEAETRGQVPHILKALGREGKKKLLLQCVVKLQKL